MNNKNNKVFNNLRTGDIILFCSCSSGLFGIIDKLLKYFTQSQYTHIGMVIKNERFGSKKLYPTKTYLWESGFENTPDPQDNKIKLGVQITDLEELMKRYKGNLYVRKLDCNNVDCARIFNENVLHKIHNQVYEKPYDCNIIDWLAAFSRYDYKPQKVDRFWCSAFISYIYTTCKVLDEKTDWSIARPSDFSIEDNDTHLQYTGNISLEKKQYLLF